MVAVIRGGLQRVALDLHVHSPASHDWQGPTIDPDDFIRAVASSGLQGIALTDHASGAWIDAVKAPARAAGVTVFPGLELNNLAGNEGIHIVALFDTEFTEADADRFLTSVGALTGTGTKLRRGSATAGPIEVLDSIRAFGGIAVLAHCATSKGALGGMRGDLRTQIVQHPALLAAEAPPEDYHDAEKGIKRKRTWDVLDGEDPTYLRELAVYSASDNPAQGHGHAVAGIGSRFTYFWMEQPITLEGLRQCLVDRRARIDIPRPGTAVGAMPRRETPSIARLRVTGGYLDKLDIGLHEGLTTILGPKGSGKSLLVELLRFALGQEPTQPDIARDHATKLEKRLEPYGRVAVDVRQPDGSVVTVEREYSPATNNPWRSPITPIDLMTCHFLSQGEVVRIAESEDEQIRFIDFRSFQTQIGEVQSALPELDRQVSRQIASRVLQRELTEKQTKLTTEVRTKERLIKGRGFARFQRAEAKSRYMESATASGLEVQGTFGELEAVLEAVPEVPAPPKGLGRDAATLRVRRIANSIKADALAAIQAASEAARKSLGNLELEQRAWQEEFAKEEDAYSQEVQKAGGDQRALSQARARLERELASVEADLAKASQIARQLQPTIVKRFALLADLRKLQDAYSDARQERCSWFEEKSGGRIQASIQVRSNRDEFRARLAALKRGSYLTNDEAGSIASALAPESFVEALLKFGQSSDPADLNEVATLSGIPLPRIITLAEFLLDQGSKQGFERLLALQHEVTPTDRPDIRFRLDDGSFAPLGELSTGQKCTALLVMALAEGDRPIIVDQPEDSLDVRSIWEDMCVRLRLAKRDRQFVFTTHNSSLAVASDSDTFVVMVGGPTRGEVILSGAIDHEEVRDEVIKLLEGGRNTYFLKQRKYHISDPYSR